MKRDSAKIPDSMENSCPQNTEWDKQGDLTHHGKSWPTHTEVKLWASNLYAQRTACDGTEACRVKHEDQTQSGIPVACNVNTPS